MKKNLHNNGLALCKILVLLAALLLTFISFSCSKFNTQKKDKISVVATIFPEYDWVRQIAANSKNIELTLLVKNGTDLHSYQPSAMDMIKISSSDLFIYVGGESDKWVSDALENTQNDNMLVVNLMSFLNSDVLEEELAPGMQSEKDSDEQESNKINSDTHDSIEIEYDEHVWLSLRNTQKICLKIASCLETLDPDNANLYAENLDSYTEQLETLAQKYENTFLNRKLKATIFCDRFPFRYLTEEFGLSYFAAFPGCSAETEASFETVAFLSSKLAELDLSCVFITESSDSKLAQTVIKNSKKSGVKILQLDSMQSTTLKQAEHGKTYINTMQKNLSILEEALK